MTQRLAEVWYYDASIHPSGWGGQQWCSNCHKAAKPRYRKAAFSARLAPTSAGGRPLTLALCKSCLGGFLLRHAANLKTYFNSPTPSKARVVVLRHKRQGHLRLAQGDREGGLHELGSRPNAARPSASSADRYR